MKPNMRKLFFAALLTTSFTHVEAAKKPSAASIVKKAEEVRGPTFSYETKVKVIDKKNGKASAPKEFLTYVNGQDAARVSFLKPSSDLGKKILMHEENMWIYMPKTAKPMRISARQKVQGNAAYGDVAGINYVKSYDAKIVREDKFKGKPVYVLDLTKKKGKEVTYDKIEYWVEKATNRPLVAHFKTNSGKTLRTGYYEDFRKVGGIMRSNRLVIKNELNKNHETTLVFSGFKKRKFPGILFKVENLSRD